MNAYAKKSFNIVKYILEANYYASLILTLSCAVMSFDDNQGVFNINSELYGPMANNLKLMLVYLFIAELSMFLFCFMKQNYRALTVVGLFLILLIGALEFYGRVNQIPIETDFYLFFLYTGLSHILYGNLWFFGQKKS